MPTLELTTMIGCPIKCTYCPQDALLAAYPRGATRMLSLPDFFAILQHVPNHVRIDFSGYAEPWANPECSTMLALALESGRNVALYTTLQGMQSPGLVLELLAAHAEQVEVVCLHLPDTTGNMRGHKDTAEWRHARDLFLAAKPGRRFETIHMGEPVLPAPALVRFRGHDRAGALDRGSLPLEPAMRHHGPVSCSFTPFYDQNVVLPNGDVYLCCNDYGLRHKLGNLLAESWEHMQRGLLLEMNMWSHPVTICASCHRATTYESEPGSRQMWKESKPCDGF